MRPLDDHFQGRLGLRHIKRFDRLQSMGEHFQMMRALHLHLNFIKTPLTSPSFVTLSLLNKRSWNTSQILSSSHLPALDPVFGQLPFIYARPSFRPTRLGLRIIQRKARGDTTTTQSLLRLVHHGHRLAPLLH